MKMRTQNLALRSLACLLACGSLPLVQAQQVIVVDPGTPSAPANLGEALNLAQAGDLIALPPGLDLTQILGQKFVPKVSIIAMVPHETRVRRLTFAAQGLFTSHTNEILLAGLEQADLPGTGINLYAFRKTTLVDCRGANPANTPYYVARDGFDIQRSSKTLVIDSQVDGSTRNLRIGSGIVSLGFRQALWNFSSGSELPRSLRAFNEPQELFGLRIVDERCCDSTLAGTYLVSCSLRGQDLNPRLDEVLFPVPKAGGPGLSTYANLLHPFEMYAFADTSFQGGEGTPVLPQDLGYSTKGPQGPRYTTGADSPAPSIVPSARRTLHLPYIGRPGHVLRLRIQGIPGDLVQVHQSAASDIVPELSPGSVRGLAAPFGPVPSLSPVTLDAQGQAEVTYTVPAIAAGASYEELWLQCRHTAPGGASFWGNPRPLFLISTGLTLLDENNNGLDDALELQSLPSMDCNGNGRFDQFEADCNGNGVPDDCDLASGAAVDLDQNGLLDSCETDCDADGVPDAFAISSGLVQDTNQNGVPDPCDPFRLYVDATAPPGGAGQSWATASSDLFRTLERAYWGYPLIREVWVRGGTYKRNPSTDDGRAPESYIIRTGLRVLGGFQGTEISAAQRVAGVSPTFLQGDIQGNDSPTGTGLFDNSRLVALVFGEPGTQHETLVDGIEFTGGYGLGGVRVLSGAAPKVQFRGCSFSNNHLDPFHELQRQIPEGAGLRLTGTSMGLEACRILGNRATLTIPGGNPGTSPNGGGLAIVNCGEVHISNTEVCGNRSRMGPGIFVTGDVIPKLLITNSTIAHNSLHVSGSMTGYALSAGVQFKRAFLAKKTTIANCALYFNQGSQGTGLLSQLSLEPGPVGSAMNPLAVSIVRYNCIQGLAAGAGQGNIGSTPLFTNPFGADGFSGTLDDNYKLLGGSPLIDAGRNGDLALDTLDLDDDGDTAEWVPFDLFGDTRRVDDPATPNTGLGGNALVDIGAREFQP